MKFLMRILGLLLAVGFVGLGTHPVQADWAFTQEATGSVYGSHNIPSTRSWSPFNPVGTDSTTSNDPNASTSTSGTITLVCKWTPNDANDKLQDVFYIAVSSGAEAYANYGLSPGPTFGANTTLDNGLLPKEQPIYTSATYGPVAKSETWKLNGVQYFLKTAASGEKGAGGSLTWRFPLTVKAQAWGTGSSGAVRVSVGAGASVEMPVFSPSPLNLALDDGSTAPKTLNQYVITTGIPTSITTNNAAVAALLKANASWTLVGTTPKLLPFEANTSTSTSGSFAIRPAQSETYQPNILPQLSPPSSIFHLPGLLFSLLTQPSLSNTTNVGWVFPASNSEFGPKTLNHVIGGVTTPANIALFFPSMGYQHSTGGPKMVDGTTSGVPNYIYYYDKVWKNP